VRNAARADANQQEIVAALRTAGYVVWNIKWPVDLLVGYGRGDGTGGWLLMEVKDGSKPPSARALTTDQQQFFRTAPGPAAVVTDVESALRAVRALTGR
jgi:hypothetical protein